MNVRVNGRQVNVNVKPIGVNDWYAVTIGVSQQVPGDEVIGWVRKRAEWIAAESSGYRMYGFASKRDAVTELVWRRITGRT